MDEAERRARTKKTAQLLFSSIKSGVGFDLWRKFDADLAKELSMFFTGVLYSREVIPQKMRELCAVASLTVLHRSNELRAHIHAALNVGAEDAGMYGLGIPPDLARFLANPVSRRAIDF